nr:transient receptor potential cation channel protein painless-like [Onthophagus taurus]
MDRSDSSFCKSPADQLLKAVQTNAISTIKTIIDENNDLINEIYPKFQKSIVQIAVSNYSKTVSKETVSCLIELGADLYLNVSDNNNQQTVHFAVLGQNPTILKTIVNKLGKNRINDVTKMKETALHLLIRDGDGKSKDFENCLDVLLENNDVDVNKEDRNGNTPIFISVRKGYKNVVAKLLGSGKRVDVDNYSYRGKTLREIILSWNIEINDQNFNRNPHENLISFINTKNEDGFINYFNQNEDNFDFNDAIFNNETILQSVCEKNLIKIVDFLLTKEIDVNQIGNLNRKSPLEIASENGFHAIFKKLLQQPSIKINENILINLLQNVIYKPNEDCNHKDCLKFLLNQNNVNIPINVYKDGNTPLHYAVKYSDRETIINLLKRGASLGNKNVEGVMPIDDIYAGTLETHLNNCIKTKNNPPCDRQSTIVSFDYSTLFCNYPNEGLKNYENVSLIDGKNQKIIPESDVILSISKNSDLKYLLKHPVISGLLYLKWEKMKPFFVINFIFYLIFMMSLIGFIFFKEYSIFYYLLSFTFTVLVLREIIELFLAPLVYVKDTENYIEFFLILATFLTIFYKNNESDLCYKQISASSIVLGSIEMMLLIGQLPLFSTYISVIKTVTWNFFKFIIWSIFLLIAFTLGFYIIYHEPKEINKNNSTKQEETDFFADPTLTFIKVIVMKIGELDASSLTLETYLSKIFFLFFIFMVTITLSNVLNGLAVSDIQTIKNNAEIVSLVERIDRIVYVEKMLLGDTLLSKILRAFVRYFCCCNDNWTDHEIPTSIAKKIFLFPYTFKNNQIEMLLYYKGEIVKENKLTGCYKKCDKTRMNSKVMKSTKEIVLKRLNSDREIVEERLLNVKRSIDKIVDESKKGSVEYLDVINNLNALEKNFC